MNRRLIGGLAALVLLFFAGAIAALTYRSQRNSQSFLGDGYILTYEAGEDGLPVSVPVYFNSGTSYQVSVRGDQVDFTDANGTKQSLSVERFLHYADDSVGTLVNGSLIELHELRDGLLNYYNVGSDSVLRAADGTYVLDNGGDQMVFSDFVWKLSEEHYLLSSPTISLSLPGGEEAAADGWVELTFVDEGIVRIESRDTVWQVLSEEGVGATLSDGSFLSLSDKAIMDGSSLLLYLNEIPMNQEELIAVAPPEQEVKIPEFDIKTIDGTDGLSGENGGTGDTGETGEAGEAGETGVTGDSGAEGAQGSAGTQGSAGSQGSSGSSGSAGSKGRTGASGSTGGTSGSGGTTSSDKVVMPVYVLTQFEYDTATASGLIEVDNADDVDGVDLTSGKLVITNIDTNETIEEITFEADELSSFNQLSFETEKLSPDMRYRLRFDVNYTLLESGSDESKEGMRTFITRTFSTSSYGVVESLNHAEENALYIKLEKKNYSDVSAIRMVLRAMEGASNPIETPEIDISSADAQALNTAYEFSDLDSNTRYELTLSVKDPGTQNYVTVSVSEYMTKKQKPKLLNPPIVAVNPKGYFEMRPDNSLIGGEESLSDPDHGILAYRYDVYNKSGELVTSVEGDGLNTVALYPDRSLILYDTDYYVVLVAEFYDNERTVEYESPATEAVWISAQQGVPYLVFMEDTVAYDSIHGDIQINFNGAPLDCDATKALELTVFNEAISGGEKILSRWIEDPSRGGNLNAIEVPVNLTGLKQNTTYRFNLYGYYREETDPSQTRQLLATAVVKTPAANSIGIHMEQILDSNAENPLTIRVAFYPGSDADMDNATEGAQYEAHKVQNIRFVLRQNQIQIGTFTKSFNIRQVGTATPSVAEQVPLYYESDFDETAYNESISDIETGNSFLIDNTDFLLSSTSLQGSNYELTAEYAEDYTATESYRYTEDVNRIALEGITNIRLNPLETAPPLPSDPMDVETITKAVARQYRLPYDAKYDDDIYPSDTVIGFVLRPQYNNEGLYAASWTLYAFDQMNYNPAEGMEDVGDGPLSELYNQLDRNQEYAFKRTFENSSKNWGSLLPGVIFMLGEGEDTRISETNTTYANYPVVYGGLGAGRGQKYTFAYDVRLNLNDPQGNASYRYPYDYEGYGDDVDNILRSENTDGEAPRIIPSYYIYPYQMNTQTLSWKAKLISDPDNAAESMLLTVGSENVQGTWDSSGSGQDFRTLTFTPANTMSERQVTTLSQFYKRFYDTGDGGNYVRSSSELTQFVHNMPHGTLSLTDFKELKDQQDDANLIYEFDVTSDGTTLDAATLSRRMAGMRLHFTARGTRSVEETVYALPEHVDRNHYRVSIPRGDLGDFLNQSFDVEAELYYIGSSETYGFGALTNGKQIALQTQEGLFAWQDTANGNNFDVRDSASGSLFELRGSTFSSSSIALSVNNTFSGTSSQVGLGLGRSGATFTAVGTQLVPRTLTATDKVTAEGTLDYIVPVVRDQTVTPSVQTAELALQATDNLEALLQGGENAVLRFTVTESGGTGSTVIEKPLNEVLSAEDGWLHLTIDGLTGGKEYTVTLSALIQGGGNSYVYFRDREGNNWSLRFETLDQIVFTPTIRLINEYYHYKMLDIRYRVNAINGVQFRIDVYETDDTSEIPAAGSVGTPVLTYEELQALKRNTPGIREEDVRFYETETFLDTETNYFRIDIAPGGDADEGSADSALYAGLLQPGKTYRVKFSAYPTGDAMTDESTNVGITWSAPIRYAQALTPSNSVTFSLDETEPKSMVVSAGISDTSNIVSSDAYVHYNDDGTVVTGSDGTPRAFTSRRSNASEVSSERLKGAYRILVWEATDAAGSSWKLITGRDSTDTGDYFTDPSVFEQLSSSNGHALHGPLSFKLQNLQQDRLYKIETYAVTDYELSGKHEIRWDDIGIDTVSDRSEKLRDYTQRTIPESGLMIDSNQVYFEQDGANRVSVSMYNAIGIEGKVKYVRASFLPVNEDVTVYGVDTGMVSVSSGDGGNLSFVTTSGGRTVTMLSLNVSFRVRDRYSLELRFYDETQTELFSVSSSLSATLISDTRQYQAKAA